MALFDDVNRKLQALGNSVTAIGEAAQSKGADLDPEMTPLSEWAQAIDNIPIEPLMWEADASTGKLTNVIAHSEITFPTQAYDGTALSTTFQPSENALRYAMGYCKKIIIPDYFITTNISWSYLNDWMTWAQVREIEINSIGSVSWQYMKFLPNLQRVKCLTSGAFNLEIRRKYTSESRNTPVYIDIPNATSCVGLFGQIFTDYVDKFEINAPKITKLGNDGSMNDEPGTGWWGDFTFPELTSISGFGIPNPPEFTSTIKAPKLTTIYQYFMYGTGNKQGKLVMYIGPNLNSMHSLAVSNSKDRINSGNLEFHIPAGDSATKTYLDNNGISYIQDYVL